MEEKKDDEDLLGEKLFIGNLWKKRDLDLDSTMRNRRNNHCWIMFLSTSSNNVIPPKTVKSVEYELHPSYTNNRPTVRKPPFLLRRYGWGTFFINATILLKNTRVIYVEYRLQFGIPLVSMSVNKKYEIYENKSAKVNEIWDKFQRMKQNAFISVTGKTLSTQLNLLKPPIILENFNHTPETVLQIIAIFFRAYGLRMPNEIVRLLIAFSTPSILLLNSHQAVIFKNCNGIRVKLLGKGKQVLISSCNDFVLQVEDLINFVEVFDSDKVDIAVVGDTGVHSYKIEKCSDLNIRFRENSSMITFINQFSKGLIQAAPFSKGDELVEFKKLNNIFKFPAESSRVRWSQRRGWSSKELTHRMRTMLS